MLSNFAVYTRQRTKPIKPWMFTAKRGCKKNGNMGGNVSFMYLALPVIIIIEILLSLLLLLLLLLLWLVLLLLLLLFYYYIYKLR